MRSGSLKEPSSVSSRPLACCSSECVVSQHGYQQKLHQLCRDGDQQKQAKSDTTLCCLRCVNFVWCPIRWSKQQGNHTLIHQGVMCPVCHRLRAMSGQGQSELGNDKKESGFGITPEQGNDIYSHEAKCPSSASFCMVSSRCCMYWFRSPCQLSGSPMNTSQKKGTSSASPLGSAFPRPWR